MLAKSSWNTSCRMNAVRSAGLSRSSVTSSAMRTDSSSVTRSSVESPSSARIGSGSHGPT